MMVGIDQNGKMKTVSISQRGLEPEPDILLEDITIPPAKWSTIAECGPSHI